MKLKGEIAALTAAAKQQRLLMLASLSFGVLLLIWAAVELIDSNTRILIRSVGFSADISLVTAVLRFSAVLVLVLFPSGIDRLRLRWVALAFAVLGSCSFIYEYLQPVTGGYRDVNASIYTIAATRSIAALLLLIGLAPRRPPRLSHVEQVVILAVSFVVIYGMELLSTRAPMLASPATWNEIQARGSSSLFDMTKWTWIIGAIPILLLLGAIAGAIRNPPASLLQRWLLPALVILLGAFVHEVLWPSSFGGFITSAKVLSATFSLLIAVGSLVDLHHIAVERQLLLEAETRTSQQLAQLAALKADFTAMVAHELASPVGAIRNFSAFLTMDEVSHAERQEALAGIASESNVLSTLVQDVQAAGEVERSSFTVRLRPVPLTPLLSSIARFGKAQPGHHPTTVVMDGDYRVLGDESRLGQVLHNLVGNAAKYSHGGAPIEVRAARSLNRVRIEVVDAGPGIRPEEMTRIFEKFGRGKEATGARIPGAGLGLYVARRILFAHGTDINVESSPGQGSIFSFDLELIP